MRFIKIVTAPYIQRDSQLTSIVRMDGGILSGSGAAGSDVKSGGIASMWTLERTCRLRDLEMLLLGEQVNVESIKRAFIHHSYVREHPNDGLEDNDRLEFLGDAFINATVSYQLFKRYPKKTAGELTRMRSSLVNNKNALASIGKELQLDALLILGEEEQKYRRTSVGPRRLANTVEALFGAILQQYGEVITTNVFLKTLDLIDDPTDEKDPVTEVQEVLQQHLGQTIDLATLYIYNRNEDTSPVRFEAALRVKSVVLGTGTGMSMKAARRVAAKCALNNPQFRERVEELCKNTST